MKLKKLKDQVIVITGASSGIGLTTARMAARHGSKLVVAARTGDSLRELALEITDAGGEALAVEADVASQADNQRIAREAIDRFGRVDSWVNNAGVGMFGKVTETPVDDMRKLFETDFWGVVYGSLTAVAHLSEQGGALINIGSAVSERAIPLQGPYSAAKHAVKGFTDALRTELQSERSKISVSLVKPSVIDTPFAEHGKNHMEKEPKLPPPVYAPELVAEAILHCCEHREREIFVGGGGAALGALGKFAPALGDKIFGSSAFVKSLKTDKYGGPHIGLEEASGNLEERGGHSRHVRETSIYTQGAMHSWLTAGLFVAAGVAFGKVLRDRKLSNRIHAV